MAFDEINSKWIDGQQRFNRHDVGVLLGMLTDSFDLEEEIDDLRQQNAQLLEACKMALEDLDPHYWTDLPGGYAVMETVDKLRTAIAAAEGGR